MSSASFDIIDPNYEKELQQAILEHEAINATEVERIRELHHLYIRLSLKPSDITFNILFGPVPGSFTIFPSEAQGVDLMIIDALPFITLTCTNNGDFMPLGRNREKPIIAVALGIGEIKLEGIQIFTNQFMEDGGIVKRNFLPNEVVYLLPEGEGYGLYVSTLENETSA